MHYEIKCEVVIDDNATTFSILISPLFDFLRAESEEINCYACVSGVEMLNYLQSNNTTVSIKLTVFMLVLGFM